MWALADAKALFRFQRPQAPELERLQTPHCIQIVPRFGHKIKIIGGAGQSMKQK